MSQRPAVDSSRSPARPRLSGRSRPYLTTRAAVLAVVVCAIMLSLAYPVREYLAQRRQIAELEETQALARKRVEELQKKIQLEDPEYIRREARRRLHYCMPGEKCYVVLDGDESADDMSRQMKGPWYKILWRSVEAADAGTRVQPAP